MNPVDSYWYGQYEVAEDPAKAAIDRAFYAARRALEQAGVDCAVDDRADSLVAAIARYTVESEDDPR